MQRHKRHDLLQAWTILFEFKRQVYAFLRQKSLLFFWTCSHCCPNWSSDLSTNWPTDLSTNFWTDLSANLPTDLSTNCRSFRCWCSRKIKHLNWSIYPNLNGLQRIFGYEFWNSVSFLSFLIFLLIKTVCTRYCWNWYPGFYGQLILCAYKFNTIIQHTTKINWDYFYLSSLSFEYLIL